MSALCAMEKEAGSGSSTARGGSVPDWDISAGTAVTFAKVSVCDQSTRPSSLPLEDVALARLYA